MKVYIVNSYIAEVNKPATSFTHHFIAESVEDASDQAFAYFNVAATKRIFISVIEQ